MNVIKTFVPAGKTQNFRTCNKTQKGLLRITTLKIGNVSTSKRIFYSAHFNNTLCVTLIY